jgi:hypothetical protein
MENFHALRVAHHHTQTNHAPLNEVFPLLCPVREAEWVPGWSYRLIFSNSGFAEEGCVFATPNDDGTETIWTVTDYDARNFRIAFVWLNPGHAVCRISIELSPAPQGNTHAEVSYTYTGLSEAGNRVLQRYDEAWFQGKMRGWESAINHYLKTGHKIGA